MTALIRIKLFVCFILFALFLILISTASAQSPSTPSSLPSPIPLGAAASSAYTLYPLPSTVSPTSPIYTDLLVNNLFHSFSCLAVGSSIIGQPCLTYQSGIPVLSQANLSGGALGATTSLIGMLYLNPPVRTADYLASLGKQFGVVKEARAQVVGSGAAVLSPILSLWQVSRNISYVVMIIIFVIIGLMVMFRQRINPQTVITAQAALPGLVIGLIMITFSFFFAGLISDMAFVGTNVVGYYFAAAQGKADDPERTNLVQRISDKNVLNIFGPLTGIVGSNDISASLDTILGQLPVNVQLVLRTFTAFLVTQFFAPLAGGIGSIATAAGGGIPWGFLVSPIMTLFTGLIGFTAPTFTLGFALSFIATLALIYTMIKLLLRLVSAFLTIIFLTISAPFQFLAAALPGRQGIATGWILNMLANILIFPAVLAVFYFIAFILGPDKVGNDYPLKVSNSLKIIGNDTLPLFGGFNLDFIKILLAFGALMALPKIPDVVVGAIGRMGQAGQLLGQEISGGVRSGQGYAGQFQGAVSGTGSTLRQGFFGDIQYQRQDGRWLPYLGRPGLIHFGKVGPVPGGGGAGRTVVPGGGGSRAR